jgi:hypothetical protein
MQHLSTHTIRMLMQGDSGSQELELTATRQRPASGSVSARRPANPTDVFSWFSWGSSRQRHTSLLPRRYSWGSRSYDYEVYRIVW